MKIRILIVLVLMGLFASAFRPFSQGIPPRPAIRLDGGGQIAVEDVSSFCWPLSTGNNQCDFSLDDQLENPLEVEAGQPLNIIIDNSPGAPTTLTLTITNASGVNGYNLVPAAQAIFDEPLPVGQNILQVDAQYADIAGVQAYISYRFQVNIYAVSTVTDGAGGATAEAVEDDPLPVPTEEVAEVALATEEPTEEPTEAATEEPTEEPTEAVTEEPTEEATEAVTEEPTEAATEEPTESATEEPTEVVTEEPTEAATEEPAESATEEPTEVVTEEPTEEPTEAVTEEPTEEPTEVVTEEPTEEATEESGQATATTVPLGGQQAPTATTVGIAAQATTETPPTATPIPPTSTPAPTATPQAPTAVPVAQPDEPPGVQLVFAGQSFAPSGVNFCQTSTTGQRICVENPLSAEGASAVLLRDFAVQVRLDGPKPAQVDFAFLDAASLNVTRTFSRTGDRLMLFNVDAPAGRYFLRMSINWGETQAEYFFLVRVN